MKIFLFIYLFLITFSASAQTFTTNMKGVVIKNVECVGDNMIIGNVVNRNNVDLGAIYVKVTVFDSDGDPIDSKTEKVILGATDGQKEYWDSTSCRKGSSFTFSIVE